MKKIASVLASAAVALSFNVSVVQADPGKGPANDTAEFCKAIADAGVTENVGECMQILRADGPPAICRNLERLDLLGLFGWDNRGQCVSWLRANTDA